MRWANITLIVFLSCSTESILNSLRPGALYQLTSGDYEGIVWLDEIQEKPSAQEFQQAAQDCQSYFATNAQQEAADRQVILDTNAATTDRLDALGRVLYPQ